MKTNFGKIESQSTSEIVETPNIEEQKKYIKNIEEHVRQLKSKIGKLKFWKK